MNMNYSIIFLFIIMSLLLSMVMCGASFLLSNKIPDKEKVSVYECGFDPFHSPGEPFSMKFFLIAILFLMFDLEMSYLFPWSCSSNLVLMKGQMMMLLFMIILTLGLIYEWLKGGLEWE